MSETIKSTKKEFSGIYEGPWDLSRIERIWRALRQEGHRNGEMMASWGKGRNWGYFVFSSWWEESGRKGTRVAESPGRGRKGSALPLFLEIERLLWPGLVSGPEMHPVTSGKCKEPQCPASTETPRSPEGTQDYRDGHQEFELLLSC